MSLFPFWAVCLFICFRRNPKIFEELLIGDVLSLTLSNYVRTNPTRIFLTGFLLREDCNFIAVDWSFLALPLSYPTAASNVQPVGVLTGNLVNFLISQGADQSQFHLMGFSMGAHVVGRAGLTTNGRLPRITGTILRVWSGISMFWSIRGWGYPRQNRCPIRWHYPYQCRYHFRQAFGIPIGTWTCWFLA